MDCVDLQSESWVLVLNDTERVGAVVWVSWSRGRDVRKAAIDAG